MVVSKSECSGKWYTYSQCTSKYNVNVIFCFIKTFYSTLAVLWVNQSFLTFNLKILKFLKWRKELWALVTGRIQIKCLYDCELQGSVNELDMGWTFNNIITILSPLMKSIYVSFSSSWSCFDCDCAPCSSFIFGVHVLLYLLYLLQRLLSSKRPKKVCSIKNDDSMFITSLQYFDIIILRSNI